MTRSIRVRLTLLAVGLLVGAAGCTGRGDATPAAQTTGATSEATAGPSIEPTSEATAATGEPTTEPTAEATPEPTEEPTPTQAPTAQPTAAVEIGPVEAVEALGGVGFDAPIEFGAYGGRLFVAGQSGVVWLFNADGSGQSTLLDIRDRVDDAGNEEGLLSVAFDGAGNLWAYYRAAGEPRRTVLSRFSVARGVADPSSELVVLEVDQPYSNHNGGAVRFGFDGMLYLGFGDGGSAHDPHGAGQDMMTLLGKVIRIDVSGASAAQPYVVPSDNPFVDVDGARPEIWALGLRNPWRMAFDPATGALWAGDVGQGVAEEISVISRGRNYGWDIVEGNICHEPERDCDTSGLTFPWATYEHSGGRCSVTGGVVYRGSAVPELTGVYVFGDYCSGEVWAMPADGSKAPVVVASNLGNISSFGTDANGEVYVVRFGRSIVRLVSP